MCKITWENTGGGGGGEKEKAEREREREKATHPEREKNLSGIPLFVVCKIYPAEEELVWASQPSGQILK